MKTRYFIFLSYSGTSYHGWQLQPSSVTVQGIVESALSVILGEEIACTGAGRTDTGVHARFFCAHFDSSRDDLHIVDKLVFRLNRYLPPDISVSSIRRVHQGSNARYGAISRTYRYYISREKDPFCEGNSWFLYGNIDINAMNEACSVLFEHSDFTSFSRLHSGARTNICRVYEAFWTEEGSKLVFTIKADRFLRNMVRAIVGTMTEIGFGKLDKKGFEDIIEARDRCRAGTSAPAKGLFLESIEYPDELFIRD